MILHVKKRGGINVFVFVFANKSAAARCHQRVCLSPLGARPTRPVDPVMMSLTRRRIPDGWWSKLRVAKDPVTDMASRSPRVARETSMMANALILLIAVMCCIKGAQSAAVPSVREYPTHTQICPRAIGLDNTGGGDTVLRAVHPLKPGKSDVMVHTLDQLTEPCPLVL
jgi:hypothetical protein